MGINVNYITQKPTGNIGYIELQNRIAEIQVPENRPIFVVAEDMTRPDYTVCTELMNHLISTRGHENITLIVGSGMHRAPSRDELLRKFGWDVQWVRTLFNNPQCNKSWLSDLVEKEHAYVISLSTTMPHMSVGMSGGNKVVLPGCAHWATIQGFHRKDRIDACKEMKQAAEDIVDFYVCMVLDWHSCCIDLFCGEDIHDVCMFKRNARKYFEVDIPTPPPDAVILEPTIKTFDFQQCMNAFNIVRAFETDKRLVKPGGVIGIVANPIDGIGVHYLFQAINGITPVYFDEVFANELRGRHLVIISNNLAENAVRDFFKTKIMLFKTIQDFEKFIEAKFNCSTINHYYGPEIMIGV